MRSRDVTLASVIAVVLAASGFTAWMAGNRDPSQASALTPSSDPSARTCTMAYEAHFDAGDPNGHTSAAEAIAADPYASNERGLVERVEREDLHVFENETAGFTVLRISGEWVVTAASKSGPCDVDPFTGERLE